MGIDWTFVSCPPQSIPPYSFLKNFPFEILVVLEKLNPFLGSGTKAKPITTFHSSGHRTGAVKGI